MTKSLVPVLILGVFASVAYSYDSDPGYGARAVSPTSPRAKARTTGPTHYYKPTMRYFGKGYTVTYRYVQWNDRMQRAGMTSFSDSTQNLPVATRGDGQEPRVVVFHAAQTQAQAPVVESTASSAAKPAVKEVPPISGSAPKKN